MPTKSGVLSPVRKGWDIRDNLCPLLSVRPLSPDTDMPVIYKWIIEDSNGQVPMPDKQPYLLGEAYCSLLASDAAQTFIGLADGNPVCEMELYKIRQHAISLAYQSRPGDYYLDLLLAPLTPQDHMAGILNNSLEYFFSFGDVRRIMAEADVKNEWMNELLKSVGFHWYQKIRVPYRITNLYFCTQRSSPSATTVCGSGSPG